MADILFIQNLPYEYPGTAAISALLKKHKHRVKLAIGSRYNSIAKFIKPGQIVAFSVMTGMQHWTLGIAEQIKQKTDCFIVLGGPHPTYYPEIIENIHIDAICRGEGEYAMLDLAQAKDKDEDCSNIANLWIKSKGALFKNDVRPLIDKLDALPDQDRDIYYDEYKHIRNNPHKTFMAGRGCPFDCSFCFNRQLRALYAGKGSFIRLRDPGRVIDEIQNVRDSFGLNKVFFHDDTFILNTDWLYKFLSMYKTRVGLPFFCTGRADTITRETAKRLKEANCATVSFAVESGNEKIRRGILKKNISNSSLTDAAKILRNQGIKLVTYNIFGIPGENINNAWETVDLNIRMKVDYPRCSLLTPYPGLEITEYARGQGYLKADVDKINTFSQQTASFIINKDKNMLLNMHHFFQTAVLFPKSIPAIRLLIKTPPNIIFQLWWALIYFFVFTLSEGRSIGSMIRFSVKMWFLSHNKSCIKKGQIQKNECSPC